MKSNLTIRIVVTSLAVSGIAQAATNPWVGDTDNNFQNSANWTGDTFPNPAADTFRFDGPGSQGNTTITNVTVALSNTGTSPGTNLGQILFSSGAPALVLTGGTISLPAGTHNNAIVLSSGATVTQTIGSNLLIGDGSAATTSIVNNSTSTGGLLKVTGNITGGSGAVTPGIIGFSFGNTSSHNGNYEVSGNISPGSASAITITKRGSGTLTLSGTNSLAGSSAGLAQNEAGSRIVINGGSTNLNNGTATHWGGNNVTGTSPVVQVSGGTLSAQSARNLRSSLVIDGGTLDIALNRLSFDAANGNKSFSMSAGALNFNDTSGGGANFGIRFGGDSGPASGSGYGFSGAQSGGTFTVKGAGNQDGTFSLGSTTASVTTTYQISGGTLDISGNNGSSGWLTIGADAGGTSTTAFTLSGSGKLVVRSAPGVSGINGRTALANQVFDFTGGTLVAGHINAGNLRDSDDVGNGTFSNNGGTIAPGDVGMTGRTQVTGHLAVNAGTVTIDLGGLAASTAFQDPLSSATFDNLFVTGNLVLGGNLGLNLVNGYVPQFTDVFKIIDVGGSLSGFFGNVADGDTLATLGNEGSFKVFSSGGDVWLGEFTVVPEPGIAALGGMGALVLLRRRKR